MLVVRTWLSETEVLFCVWLIQNGMIFTICNNLIVTLTLYLWVYNHYAQARVLNHCTVVVDNECAAHEKTASDTNNQSSKDELENITAALQTLLCNIECKLFFSKTFVYLTKTLSATHTFNQAVKRFDTS